MRSFRSQLQDLPLPLRLTFVAGAISWPAGAIIGLAVGLAAHPATAWFAIFEGAFLVGLPCTVLGLLVGLLAAACRFLWARLGAKIR